MSKLMREQGATSVSYKFAISHPGCRDFSVPLRYASVEVPSGTPLSVSLAGTEKSLATRPESTLKMDAVCYNLINGRNNTCKPWLKKVHFGKESVAQKDLPQ